MLADMVYDINQSMLDYKSLQFITSNYRGLQGLRMVPVGLVLLLWAVLDPWWMKSNLRDTAKLLSMAIAVAAFIFVGKRYERMFGRVDPHRSSPLRTILVLVVFFGLYLASHYVDEHNPAISWSALLYAGFYAVAYWGSGRRRIYCLATALVFCVLAVAPLTSAITADQLFAQSSSIGNVVFGVSLVVIGLLDHLLIRRMLVIPVWTGDV